jgi:AraC-like DNA-binding protein
MPAKKTYEDIAELLRNPELRLSDIARRCGLSKQRLTQLNQQLGIRPPKSKQVIERLEKEINTRKIRAAVEGEIMLMKQQLIENCEMVHGALYESQKPLTVRQLMSKGLGIRQASIRRALTTLKELNMADVSGERGGEEASVWSVKKENNER